MKLFKNKPTKIFFLFLIIGSTTFGIFFFLPGFFSPSLKVVIFYDPSTSTTVKSNKLFIELIENPNIAVKSIPISSQEEFETKVSEISKEIFALALIGHGSWLGIQFGSDIIRWETVRKFSSTIAASQFLMISCYSSIVPLGLSKHQRRLFFGFETKIDYMIACYSAAQELAIGLQNPYLLNKINEKANNVKDILLFRAVFTPEPLWGGTTHNKLAEIARDYEVGSTKWNKIDSDTRSYMDDASRADKDDRIRGASILDILLDPGRYVLWLRHNYGMRGGIEVYAKVLWIKYKLLSISATSGTAPQAAQNAYNWAIRYYKGYYKYYFNILTRRIYSIYVPPDYIKAGKQLSYAIHYGQDMTMPYHVFDYVKLKIYVSPFYIDRVLALIDTITGVIDDYFDLDSHNKMESWVDNNWDYVNNDQIYYFYRWSYISKGVKSIAFSNSISIGSGSNAVKDAVTSIAEWTRTQMTESEADAFNSKSDYSKRNEVKYLLAKAVDYSTALYEKFINEVTS